MSPAPASDAIRRVLSRRAIVAFAGLVAMLQCHVAAADVAISGTGVAASCPGVVEEGAWSFIKHPPWPARPESSILLPGGDHPPDARRMGTIGAPIVREQAVVDPATPSRLFA